MRVNALQLLDNKKSRRSVRIFVDDRFIEERADGILIRSNIGIELIGFGDWAVRQTCGCCFSVCSDNIFHALFRRAESDIGLLKG